MSGQLSVVSEGKVQRSPADMIELAVNQGADLEKLEKLLDLQERWQKNEARKAYVEAMSAFKADPPKIEKDKHVSYATSKGTTSYSHATLANVTDKINKALSRHGLSAAWHTAQAEGLISVTCTITHVLGHSESCPLSARADDSGGKNSIQAIGSTVSYLQRYTLLSLTGLATADMDDDGAKTEYISLDQETVIRDLIAQTKTSEKSFLKYLQVERLAELPTTKYQTAISALEARKNGGNK